MKEKYYTPFIEIEDLDKSDVLLSSGEIVTPSDPEAAELENAYHDISDFILSGPSGWFD